MAEKELEKKGTTEVDIFQGSGTTGFEETSSDSYKMPLMKVLSKSSGEVDPDSEKFDPNAKAGQFYNVATGEAFDELNVIPLKISHQLFVWGANMGNGLKGIYPLSEKSNIVVTHQGYDDLDIEGNKVKEVLTFYFMDAEDKSSVFALSLSSTSFKYGQSFATRLRNLKKDGKSVGVTYAGVWNIKTVKSTKGSNSWYTIGNSPKFSRFIEVQEYNDFIHPALDMLKDAEVDHGVSKEDTETVNTPY